MKHLLFLSFIGTSSAPGVSNQLQSRVQNKRDQGSDDDLFSDDDVDDLLGD
jgi:hypothetical protein